jgi:hypothetical protein
VIKWVDYFVFERIKVIYAETLVKELCMSRDSCRSPSSRQSQGHFTIIAVQDHTTMDTVWQGYYYLLASHLPNIQQSIIYFRGNRAKKVFAPCRHQKQWQPVQEQHQRTHGTDMEHINHHLKHSIAHRMQVCDSLSPYTTLYSSSSFSNVSNY